MASGPRSFPGEGEGIPLSFLPARTGQGYPLPLPDTLLAVTQEDFLVLF